MNVNSLMSNDVMNVMIVLLSTLWVFQIYIHEFQSHHTKQWFDLVL